MEWTGQMEPAGEDTMKKTLLTIVLAAAAMPLAFAAQAPASTPAPADSAKTDTAKSKPAKKKATKATKKTNKKSTTSKPDGTPKQ